MKIRMHMSLCRPEREKTINESTKLGLDGLWMERYEKADSLEKWKYSFNGHTLYKVFISVDETLSDQLL